MLKRNEKIAFLFRTSFYLHRVQLCDVIIQKYLYFLNEIHSQLITEKEKKIHLFGFQKRLQLYYNNLNHD